MRRLILAAALLPLAAPAMAQDTAQDMEADLDHVARTLGDPARQEALASAMGAMAEVLLDLPLAPIVGPLAEAAGEVVGEPGGRIDPDATLRKMAPGAGAVPRQIERQLPRAMGTMAGMSGAFAGMIPQLREAAERIREALPAELP